MRAPTTGVALVHAGVRIARLLNIEKSFSMLVKAQRQACLALNTVL